MVKIFFNDSHATSLCRWPPPVSFRCRGRAACPRAARAGAPPPPICPPPCRTASSPGPPVPWSADNQPYLQNISDTFVRGNRFSMNLWGGLVLPELPRLRGAFKLSIDTCGRKFRCTGCFWSLQRVIDIKMDSVDCKRFTSIWRNIRYSFGEPT